MSVADYIRNQKRSGSRIIRTFDENYELTTEYVHFGGHGLPHVPMKREAKVLRQLMAETGLTEVELREHKKYRILLSEAQKSKGPGKSAIQRFVEKELKSVTRELKLAKEHPLVKEQLRERLEKPKFFSRYYPHDLLGEAKRLNLI